MLTDLLIDFETGEIQKPAERVLFMERRFASIDATEVRADKQCVVRDAERLGER